MSAVAAMVAGVAVNRPARRAPWLLLAAANLAAALGGLGLHVASVASHPAVPLPAFGDGAYLVDYPLYVAGLALFIRSRSTGGTCAAWPTRSSSCSALRCFPGSSSSSPTRPTRP